ncbi:hypothetical protein [Kordiimonas aestuarii]|uniref:hypothetical protein n=1 Tax=Kordiimonas aestuarii TaxID=1005925 RepID=UPI0021CEE1BE|nr:hypothetical protein [Kordiimonas aestuarii]
MTGLGKLLTAGFALASGIAISNSASAATIYGELLADPGSYGAIALGDSITLDGCGSVFDYNPSKGAEGTTVSLCNGVTDLSPFDFTWAVYNSIGQQLGYLAQNSITPLMTTGGMGDIITVAGSYYLSLNVTLSPTSATFALPGGDTGAFQPTNEPFYSDPNPDPNSDTRFTTVAFIVNPASVPEPAGALLLLPAMVYMARRERKRRKTATA